MIPNFSWVIRLVWRSIQSADILRLFAISTPSFMNAFTAYFPSYAAYNFTKPKTAEEKVRPSPTRAPVLLSVSTSLKALSTFESMVALKDFSSFRGMLSSSGKFLSKTSSHVGSSSLTAFFPKLSAQTMVGVDCRSSR